MLTSEHSTMRALYTSLVPSKSFCIEILFCYYNSILPQNGQNGQKTPLTDDIMRPTSKNAKLRLNIITVDTLRATRVFIAFTFPQPSENEVQSFFDAKESFLPYKSSAGVLLEKWRSKGAMNFGKDDADHSIYKFYILSDDFYALSKAMIAANRCFLFCF